MPDNTINIVPTQLEHLKTLKSWFPDKKTSYDWCGPGLRYPFTQGTFLEDIHWENMPAYSLLNENKELIGFGQPGTRITMTLILWCEKASHPK
jgi:hypothetical protein